MFTGIIEELARVKSIDKIDNFYTVQITSAFSDEINIGDNKVAILMDELDGMGVGDRGGLSELIKLILTSKFNCGKKLFEISFAGIKIL